MIEDYAKNKGFIKSKMYLMAEAIMIMDYYLTDMNEHYGKENLYTEEKKLTKMLKSEGYLNESNQVKKRFFVIGINMSINENFEGVMRHELSHTLYRIDEDYKILVHEVFDSFDTDHRMYLNNLLKHRGYNEKVFATEWISHMIHGFSEGSPERVYSSVVDSKRVISYFDRNLKLLDQVDI